MDELDRVLEMKLPVEIVEGFEPDPNASTAPIKQGQGRQNRNSRNSSNSRKSNNSGNSNRNSSRDNKSRRPSRNNDRRN